MPNLSPAQQLVTTLSTNTTSSACDACKATARKMPSKYLRMFFAEKDVPEVVWELESPTGAYHQMPVAVVVEHIAVASDKERASIENMLRRLDFANAPVIDFLHHLACCIVLASEPEDE